MARNLEFNEDEVIQKAMEVFWRKGYAATSMRDLTDAMQINISSLYNSIGDKHELFIRCIRHYTNGRIQSAQKRVANFDSPFAALESFINDAAKTIISEPNSCMCVKATFETEGNDPEVQKAINEYNDHVHQFIKRMVENAQEAGEIAAHEDADIIADYLDSLFTGWYNSFIMHKDGQRILKMAGLSIRQLKQ